MPSSRRDFIRRSTLAALGLPLLPRLSRDGASRDTSSIILPPRLREGATVGLIAPAGAIYDTVDVNVVQETLATFGLNTFVGVNALNRRGYLAGTDDERAADVMTMFADSSIDAILSLRGGWGVNRILQRLDFGLIRRNPKIIMGYSDITSLLLAIYAKTGMVTFHGPVGISTWNAFSTDHVRRILFEAQAPELRNPAPTSFPVPADDRIRTIGRGTARGRLAGGNLSVLVSMLGSDFLPNWEGHLLFLEDVDERVYRIDRMLTQLKLAGVLDAVEGVIWGRCSNCTAGGTYGSLTLHQVLRDHLAPLRKPVFYGSMIGHITDKFTVPVGVSAEMDADSGVIRILEPAVQ